VVVRWERLFEDLEAQLVEAAADELRAEVADRTQREVSELGLADRLRAGSGAQVALRVTGVGVVSGTVRSTGPDWVLLAEPLGVETLVSLAAVVQVTGLGSRASLPRGELARRLGLGYALRGLARDRAVVRVVLTDGSTLAGTIDRVGADHFDVTERSEDGGGPWTVRFGGLAVVRRPR
jgi:hypothetical protein